MKCLYIIGNGFDIFTGLKTSYSDFCKWLKEKYAFIYEALAEVYDIKGNWWNEFETQLGRLDIRSYVQRYRPAEIGWEQLEQKIEDKKALEQKLGSPILPNFSYLECANRMEGLLDVLQFCFEKWVADQQTCFSHWNILKIEKKDSFFVNFNYTDVLEILYGIPEERVFHIHGRASKRDRLVFGHDKMMLSSLGHSLDEEKVGEVLDGYNKNPYSYLSKYNQLPEILKDVEHVYIYGFAFSPVDVDYIDWIYKRVPNTCAWDVSWFTEKDRSRIDAFVFEHWILKERINYVRLDDLNENY